MRRATGSENEFGGRSFELLGLATLPSQVTSNHGMCSCVAWRWRGAADEREREKVSKRESV